MIDNANEGYALIIDKYGKSGIMSKYRVLILDKKNVSYYPSVFPQQSQMEREFRNNFTSLSQKDFKSESYIEKAKLLYNVFKHLIDKNLVRIKRSFAFNNDGVIFEKIKPNIVYIKPRDNSNKDYWECSMTDEQLRCINKMKENIKNFDKPKDNSKTIRKEQEKTAAKTQQKGEKSNDFDDLNCIDNIEQVYQSLLDKYITTLLTKNNTAKLIDIELSIEILFRQFSLYCEKIIRAIVSYLTKKDFAKENGYKIIPIFYPNFSEIQTDNNHFYVFYFKKITFTMTWNYLSMPTKAGKLDPLFGAWDDIKLNFKQSEIYTNLILDWIKELYEQDKNENEIKRRWTEKNRMPLMCIIDYCGFRFLCETDIKTNINRAANPDCRPDIEEYSAEYSTGNNDAVYKKCKERFNDLFGIKENDNLLQNKEQGQNTNIIQKTDTYYKFLEIVSSCLTKGVIQPIMESNLIIEYPFFSDTENKKIGIVKYFYSLRRMPLFEMNEKTKNQSEVFSKKKKHYFRPELITLMRKNNFFNDSGKRVECEKDLYDQLNDERSLKVDKTYKEKFLLMFINSLDSFYSKLFDSESMSQLFHLNGINIFTLGAIAEKAESPFLREFLIIEMLARTCKKLVYHCIAETIMRGGLETLNNLFPAKPPNIFNVPDRLDLFPLKFRKKICNPNDPYFSNLKEYFVNGPHYKNYQEGSFIFYQNIWMESSTLEGDERAKIFVNLNETPDNQNTSSKTDNDPSKKDKQNDFDDKAHLEIAKGVVVKFMKALFDKQNSTIVIKGKEMSHRELWNYIIDEIKSYFDIDSKEILIFCQLKCLSLAPFLEAFQYHTGIELDLGLSPNNPSSEPNSNVKEDPYNFYPRNDYHEYNNRYIKSIEWKKENILFFPVTQTYTIRSFLSNKKKVKQFQGNYSQLIVNNKPLEIRKYDKHILLRYYYEKIFFRNKFTYWYIMFVNELKHLDDILIAENEKENLEEIGNQNINNKNNVVVIKHKDTIEFYKKIYREINPLNIHQNPEEDYKPSDENNEGKNGFDVMTRKLKLKFDRLCYLMINIAKEIDTIDEESVKLPNNIKTMKNFDLCLFKAEDKALQLITNYYIQSHPYYCEIKELCAKEIAKRWLDNTIARIDDIIEIYFKSAIDTGIKCLGNTNIYLANIALDVGLFYSFRKKYLEAVKILNWAYIPFKQNSQDFQRDYLMFLKRFIKYNIKLGDFKSALSLGDELLNDYKSIKEDKDRIIKEKLHLERIVYNLALIALKTNECTRGILYCKELFRKKGEQNPNANLSSVNHVNENDVKRQKTEYYLWQDEVEKKLPLKEEVELEMKIKLYLKIIIQSLNEDNKVTYLQALLRIYDSTEEQRELKKIQKPTIDVIYKKYCSDQDLNDLFKLKILPSMKARNKEDDIGNDKSQSAGDEQKSNYNIFRELYLYFEDKKVFYDFIDKPDLN